MSLLVWLPLNGNLENKGLNLNISITNNGATVNNAGKIGKCYSFTNQTIVVTPSTTLKNSFSTQSSLALWVKVSTSHSAYALAITFGTVGVSWNNILFGIDINNNGVPIGNTSNGSTYANCSFDTAIKDNQWHHLAFTYNNGVSKGYLDGVLKRTVTSATAPAWTSCTALAIGGLSSEVFKNGDCINDVRLYNNCLSDEEVKKISQGLVLHYPLTEREFEMTKNMINIALIHGLGSSWTELSNETYQGLPIYRNAVTSPNSGNNAGFCILAINGTTVPSINTVVTISFWKRLNTVYGRNLGGYIRFNNSSNNSTYWWTYNKPNWANDSTSIGKWEKIIGQVTITTAPVSFNVAYVYVDNATGGNCDFSNILLEWNDHATAYTPSQRGGQYDKTIYQEPDGSLWVRMFHHNNPAGGLFTSSDTFTTGVYKDANRWFDIYGVVDQLSRYEFMVKLKTTSDATEVKYRWIQYANPVTAQWEEVTAAKVTRITTSGYTNGGLGGLYYGRPDNGSTQMIINNGAKGNWFGAAGCWTLYQGGIPGYPSTAVTSGYMDIYARVDDLEFVKIYDISGYNNHSLVIGSLLSSTDSVRYDRSIKKSNGSYIKSLYRPNDFLPHDQITVNIWVKYSTWSNPVSCTNGGGFNFEANSSHNYYIEFPLYISGQGYAEAVSSSERNSLKNNWHMLTGVFDGTNIIIYIDGVESGRNSVQRSGAIGYANNWLFLGAEAAGDTVTPEFSQYEGNLSDFRVYATALSTDDVAALYRLGI